MRKILLSVLAFILLLPLSSLAQDGRDLTEVMPMPPSPQLRQDYQVEELVLEVEVNGQQANCNLRTVIRNTGHNILEMDYLAPLPEGGAVSGLTLLADGKEMPGEVYPKDKALAIYQKIVSDMRDPALLEYAGRNTYLARIFPIPPKETRTLDLRFVYLLPKENSEISLQIPLAGPLTIGKTVTRQEVLIKIQDTPGLKNIYTPLDGADVDTRSDSGAVIKFKAEKTPALDMFRLFFQAEKSPLGGMILSHKPDTGEDGFFLFLAEPDLSQKEQTQAAKNVIFALDKSGSMSGAKFKQAQGAIKFVLERLNKDDNFNLIDYSSKVSAWRPELMDMSPANRKEALQYVDDLRVGGSTNIEEALLAAFKQAGGGGMPTYILFMTDGVPTAGITDEVPLANVGKRANAKNVARLFAFGVGYDVNARLLDRLSGQAGGASVFVAPNEDIESKVAAFFAKMDSPALTRPQLDIDRKTNRIIPAELPDMFVGGQLVVVGRYPKGGDAEFKLEGKVGEGKETYAYKAKLADGPTEGGDFIALLWAQRRIGEIIDEIDLAGGQPNKELVNELVELSKRYGILTPYTSFLALEDQAITSDMEILTAAGSNLSAMEDTVGQGANLQREMKAEYMRADKAPAPMAAAPEASQAKAEQMAAFDQMVAKADPASLHLPNQWGGQTFYYKNGQWQDSTVTEAQLKNPKVIAQFSDAYFELAKTLRSDQMVWLSQSEPVLLNHRGMTYLIEPAVKN